MNRRELLKLAVVSGAVAACGGTATFATPSSDPMDRKPLRDVAAANGLVFGSSARRKQLQSDYRFRDLFLQQCGILVPELELKWEALRPTPDEFDFADADWMCTFAETYRLLFRGHTLVWDAALPAWFEGYATKSNASALLTKHIRTVVGRYAGKIHSWDVVNEAIELADRRADGLKNSPWLSLIGPEYIELAFRTAHEADPHAMLVYNENFLEPETPESAAKRRTTLRILTDLKKRNVPLHALGVQAHLYAEANASGPDLAWFLREISDLGLKILVTEMDVRDKNLPAAINLRDQQVADSYFHFLRLVLGLPSTTAVLTWGLTDRYTWIARSHPRRDALPVRPLPYDETLNPKLARTSMVQAIEVARAGHSVENRGQS